MRERPDATPIGVWVARAAGLVGLSAASAIAAHAGPAGFTDPALLSIALTGALIAAVALGAAGIAAIGARRLATALTVHDLARTGRPTRIAPLSGSAVLAAMLACQTAAHVALLLTGVPMSSSQVGTIAVHVVAAAAASAIWLAVDGLVGRSFGALEAAIVALIALLQAAAAAMASSRPSAQPVGARVGVFGLPRGPPSLKP